ncbi:MAG: M23 family metallopeptidase [Actinobacteria bacterium]|nr:M23 family metallopeptidase [Actinomycetota bacterium]
MFAATEGLELTTPSAEPVYIGFHEASYSVALPLVPHGRQRRNDNPGKTNQIAPGPGPDFAVLSSRGRPNSATTAVDVVLAPGDPVLSVVSGTVAEVRPYLLYGEYADNRIEIIPAGRPDMRVTMIHMTGVEVAVGQEVVRGETVLAAGANQFPFLSHIDGYIDGQRHAHVHIEVKRAG